MARYVRQVKSLPRRDACMYCNFTTAAERTEAGQMACPAATCLACGIRTCAAYGRGGMACPGCGVGILDNTVRVTCEFKGRRKGVPTFCATVAVAVERGRYVCPRHLHKPVEVERRLRTEGDDRGILHLYYIADEVEWGNEPVPYAPIWTTAGSQTAPDGEVVPEGAQAEYDAVEAFRRQQAEYRAHDAADSMAYMVEAIAPTVNRAPWPLLGMTTEELDAFIAQKPDKTDQE